MAQRSPGKHLHDAAGLLGFVAEQVGDGRGPGEEPIDVTVAVAQRHEGPGPPSHKFIVKCTSESVKGQTRCKDIGESLTEQGCKCKDIKNGVSCECT